MSDIDMWSLIVGFVSATFVLPIIQQPHWSDRLRSAVTFGYCLIVGLGTTWFTGGLDQAFGHNARSAVRAVLLVFVSAISTYKGFAKPTGIAPMIEHATVVTGRAVSPRGAS